MTTEKKNDSSGKIAKRTSGTSPIATETEIQTLKKQLAKLKSENKRLQTENHRLMRENAALALKPREKSGDEKLREQQHNYFKYSNAKRY